MVVANDADTSRCFMLAHQLRRFGQDSVLVTNHEAQSFPLCRPAAPQRPRPLPRASLRLVCEGAGG